MDIYLPVAEMSVNLFVLLGMGGGIGFLSGVFGVGGGFLLTPMLFFVGVPPAVAVGSQASQILASSFSGVLAHFRRGNVDIKMGFALVVGGAAGSVIGVALFALLRSLGQIDLAISLCYVVFLGVVGSLMFVESARALLRMRRARRGGGKKRKLHKHNWIHGLPLKMRFQRSRLYISAAAPALVGLMVGMLAAIMGVGGGFVMVPAMIYFLGMPTQVVVGTSLFQICFVAALTSFLHAWANQTVDIVLSLLLIVGGVMGAQIGTRVGAMLRGEQLRILLALMVLAVGAKLGFDLVATPKELYALG